LVGIFDPTKGFINENDELTFEAKIIADEPIGVKGLQRLRICLIQNKVSLKMK